ncbi:hypothetical protein DIS24_g4667 [Lasiodiplodia hormozganensis]|uniref:Uncharacterized protein n=1 Tax=Lasiodiplodia hormozganensis TaxID=869390 RepID=A0AA39YVR4_9PEZI|nr:hypothetical protein DIS24_g4667 [Lasiodiplodia hormozganensis]
MASTTSTPYTCLTVAEWRPDGFSGRERNLGILSEKPSSAHLSANFKFENGPYAAIHLELAPSTVSDEHDYNFPDQTISIVISAGNIHSISQDLPGWEYMPTYVKAEYKKHEARMHKQGIFNSQLKQAVRLDLTLKRTPVVLMPRHARSLVHPQDMARVQTLKSLSRMTSFVLFFVRSDRMISDLRQFRTESRELSFDGSPAALFDNLTHFSFSGPDEAHWSRYRVQQQTVAALGQKRSLQDNHGNSPTNEGSHGVKRTKHNSTPAYGLDLSWIRQSEPPMPNPHFGQAFPQSVFTSGTATLEKTQAKPSGVPNAHSKVESAPKIFNRSPARFESARASLLRHRASSVTDHATRKGTQVPTSCTTEPFTASIMKLQTDSDPVRSNSDNQNPPTAASALISNSREQTPTASKKKKSHPPRRRHRPENEEDGNDPKRTGEGGLANGGSAMVPHVKSEHVLPSHTSFCPVLHSSSAADSSSVIATGTPAQSTPALSYPQIGPDEMVKRWRVYHDWTLLSSVNFGLDTMLDVQGLLSSSLRAARAGDVTTFADKMADLFMLVDENKEHQG